ncbi:MAG: ABC transporter ATP-binding protein, partial [Sphingomicrobium sp.]
VVIVSHDRHMIELTADRLVLVEDGRAQDYAGSIDDYIDFVLGRNQPRVEPKAKPAKADKKAAAKARGEEKELRKKAAEAEAASERLAALCSALDQAMFDPASAEPDLASLPMSELSSRRARIAADLAAAEALWLEANDELEKLAA